LASNALAIRIIFPSVGAIQASFSLTGLPASLGKQIKKGAEKSALFFTSQKLCLSINTRATL